jgi:ankyrin repeat protein
MKQKKLIESIKRKNFREIDELILEGALVNSSYWLRLCFPSMPTPLQASIWIKEKDIVIKLLNYGADPNLDTRKWMSPLALACQNGDLIIAQTLLDHGAYIMPLSKKHHPSAIEVAAWYGHESVVRFLLERGADPDTVLSRDMGSLVRISKPILKCLITAGGHAPLELSKLVDQEKW